MPCRCQTQACRPGSLSGHRRARLARWLLMVGLILGAVACLDEDPDDPRDLDAGFEADGSTFDPGPRPGPSGGAGGGAGGGGAGGGGAGGGGAGGGGQAGAGGQAGGAGQVPPSSGSSGLTAEEDGGKDETDGEVDAFAPPPPPD